MRPRLVPELICQNLKQSLGFYVGQLEFRILYERPEAQFVYLELQGAEIMLEQPQTHDRLWPKAELMRPFGRGVNFQLEMTNVERIYSNLKKAGVEFFLELEEKWYRRDDSEIGVLQFAVQDPDGYLIRPSQSLGTRLSKGTP